MYALVVPWQYRLFDDNKKRAFREHFIIRKSVYIRDETKKVMKQKEI